MEETCYDTVVSKIVNFIEWFCKPRKTSKKSEVSTSEGVRRINDELHQIYTDGNDDFEVIVILFHGFVRSRDLDLDPGGDIHVSNWISKDEDTNSDVLWPRVWLVDEFPKSRIYTVKYDASIKATDTAGRSSLHNLVENMVVDIILAFPPEFWSRPVVLVGHSFGGIVIKQFLLFAQKRYAESKVWEAKQTMTISNFLNNVKLIFYISTPHHGLDIKIANRYWTTNKMLEEYAEHLNPKLAILDGDFGVLTENKRWLEAGVGEQNYTKWDSINVHALVVSEASTRHRTRGHYLSVPEDHFSISRPRSRRADSFDFLVKHIREVLPVRSESVTQKPKRLNPSQILRGDDWLRSPNGVYRLVLQKEDKNLVLYGRGRKKIWSSKPWISLDFRNCECFFVMQTDGNAVIYAVPEGGAHRPTAIWATNTNHSKDDASRYIEVQNDGNVVMYDEWRRPVWATNTWDIKVLEAARLTSDQVLERGAFLMSQNEGYKLEMQDDCNLVLYRTTGSNVLPIWASNTYRSEKVKDCNFIMQADGNAVIYAGDTEPLNALWASNTFCQTAGAYYIEINDNGHIVMWDAPSFVQRKAVWATPMRGGPLCTDKITSGQIMYAGDSRVSLNRHYILLMQWDGNLVLYKNGEGQIWASGTACQTYSKAVLSYETQNCYFIMNPNGNAEIHVGSEVRWSTETTRRTYNGTYYLEVQNDGNMVMYDMVDHRPSREQIWATHTARAL